MPKPPQTPPWMFNLEGTILGFSGKKPHKPKAIILEVEQEQLSIKLPKQLRQALYGRIGVGDRICCVGRSQIQGKTGAIILEASLVFSLSPASQNEASPLLPPVPQRCCALITPTTDFWGNALP